MKKRLKKKLLKKLKDKITSGLREDLYSQKPPGNVAFTLFEEHLNKYEGSLIECMNSYYEKYPMLLGVDLFDKYITSFIEDDYCYATTCSITEPVLLDADTLQDMISEAIIKTPLSKTCSYSRRLLI